MAVRSKITLIKGAQIGGTPGKPVEHDNGYAGKVKYAQLLNDASEIKFVDRVGHGLQKKNEDTLILSLPVRQPDVIVPVIELFLK